MWFPETTRSLVAQGAEVILHPSLTSTIDRPIELANAVASAAIHQCFIFDINGLGAGGTGRSIVVGPAGDLLHQAGGGEEMIPIEVDFDRVRRSREVGLRGLGQPLKSFRDRKVAFPVYDEVGGSEYLRSLGPLKKPARGSRAGLTERPRGNSPQVGVAISEDRHLDAAERTEGADLPAGVNPPISQTG
jgi:hypothetical protein